MIGTLILGPVLKLGVIRLVPDLAWVKSTDAYWSGETAISSVNQIDHNRFQKVGMKEA
jgi:hypothetical protein